MMSDILIKLGVSSAVLFGVLNLAGLQTWLERKQSALMQDRIGANRACFRLPWVWAAPINWILRKLGGLGILNALADVIKMLTKEDFIPAKGDKFLHGLAPLVSICFALLAFAAIPIGPPIILFGREMALQVTNVNAGLLFVLALGSIGIYGVMIAGIASNNNLATLGALRAA